MVEQERIRTQINERLLEILKTTDKEGKNNHDPMKEMEDMRIEQGLGEPPIELGDKESAQGCSKGSLCLDKGKLDLSLVIQAEEVKQIPTEVEEMEKDRGLDLQEKDQENRVRVITVGELVIQQKLQRTGKVQEAIDKQTKRMFRRLKSPTKTRRPLKEINGNEVSQLNIGKRNVLIRDEEMEEVNKGLVQWKKTKPVDELYSSEMSGEEVGSFLNGTSQGK